MFGKLTLLVLGLLALTTLTLAQSRVSDDPEPPGSLIDIDTEISKEKEEVPEESGSGKSIDDEDDEGDDDLDKSSGSGSGTDEDGSEETTTVKTLKGCANLYEASKHLLGNFVPQCDEKGDYLPKQCRGHASTGRCWCVDNNGAEIPGTAVEPPNELDCVSNKSLSRCLFAVVMAVRHPRIGQYKPKCKINGAFESRQCHGSICFCVDQDGEKLYGTERAIHQVTADMCQERVVDLPDHTEGVIVSVDKPVVKNPKPTPTKPVNPEYTIPSKNPIVEVETPVSEDDDSSEEDPITTEDEDDDNTGPLKEEPIANSAPIMTQPGLLAAIIGGAVVGLLCAILLVMFIVYRMRKKDEGSYALDEPRKKSTYSPINQTDKEYYA